MSFNIALSGINAINKQLTITSHNIANSGTVGFKSSRANFATMVAGNQGGGTSVASVTQNIGGGDAGVVPTGRKFDAAIHGNGFFVTRNSEGATLFTRVGIFHRQDDYMVDGFGHRVQGYSVGGAYGDLHIPAGTSPAKASTNLSYAGNLSADVAVPKVQKFDMANEKSYSRKISSTVYDSLGVQHVLDQYFVKMATPPNTYQVHYGMNGAKVGETTVLTFDEQGALKGYSSGTVTVGGQAGAAALTIKVDHTGTTQYAGNSTTTTNQDNGHAAGVPGEPTLDQQGNIVIPYSNGEKRTLGTLALATFPNPDGLETVGDTAWVAGSASGNPLLGKPGTGGVGVLEPGALELSNADVTNELVTMMAAQRNYQANSKVLSIENQMMQSLMQAL
ncbi:flagellar hook protein FlgE [Pandoraea apista]|uniref:flagellar hook protein FlgE n=1 Tax=Pandoraea apista TaxID=93218 RepID=UPI000F6749FF|nr:flagellar hook-basal body complex protein [Pandoraea apista]RRW88815.1 flagellar hook-basal body complex protein [Pandoraea apista]RRW98074.1 flagellar hook-basal body complex protein [Pandoraea apista]